MTVKNLSLTCPMEVVTFKNHWLSVTMYVIVTPCFVKDPCTAIMKNESSRATALEGTKLLQETFQ